MMVYKSGKTYLEDWDAWDKHQKSGGQSTLFDTGASVGKTSVTIAPPCCHSHPALPLPGTDHVMFGGSCSAPIVKDADIYIGFDPSMKRTGRAYPWNKGEEILFRVTDMGVPDNHAEYAKMVFWVGEQITIGRKVHAGCIGGHGRTGMFLAAVVSAFGEKDAINYVRTHYCKRAVESDAQVEFLGKHFGILPAKGYKQASTISTLTSSGGEHKRTSKTGKSKEVTLFNPVSGQGCIWG